MPLADTVLFCLHGAGDAALTWAPVAARLAVDSRLSRVAIVAVDLRGHGETHCATPEGEADLSIERLVADSLELIDAISARHSGADVFLVGHSLGGAVATRAATEGLKRHPAPPIKAVLLLDTVEGTALEGLPRTAAWLEARPGSFESADEAISWAVSSRMISSQTSARITMPPRLRWDTGAHRWFWRANIAAAQNFWRGWFEGVSALFVGLSLPKLLVLGGVDHLDAALMVANMQGRFRLEVLPQQGHQLHEDRPGEVAEAFAGFIANVRRQQNALRARLLSGASSPSSVCTNGGSKRQRSSVPEQPASSVESPQPAESSQERGDSVATENDSTGAVSLSRRPSAQPNTIPSPSLTAATSTAVPGSDESDCAGN